MAQDERGELMSGLLANLTEVAEIQRELDCSADEAFKLQRQRAEEREPSNVIKFRPRS
jgi:hypothetical protein